MSKQKTTKRKMTKNQGKIQPVALYDRWLLFATFSLFMLGLLMVYSSSIVISDRLYGQPFHFLIRQGVYLSFGFLFAMIIVKCDIRYWRELGVFLLLASILLLMLVLVHGIGHEVNGSIRWITLGPIGLQPSEIAKFSVIIYLAGYLVRRDKEIKKHMRGFLKPLLLVGIIAILLLREPDFGTTAVILVTALGMMFLAGVKMWQFGALLCMAGSILGVLAFSSHYRVARLMAFLHPWSNPFDSGYQLTQSLIAFGRGGWWGVGLGESVQKLFYLPEAHTDFLFAVLAEELGLVGILTVLFLFAIVVGRAIQIGKNAYLQGKLFNAYLAYGFGLWIALQAMINIGVNSGMLPTKGLTLPFMSSGGTSLLIMCIVTAILLRIDYESRRDYYGLS